MKKSRLDMKNIKYIILLLVLVFSITTGFRAFMVEAKSKTPEIKVTKVNDASAKKVIKQAKKNKKFILKVKASSRSKAKTMFSNLSNRICDVTTYGAPLDIPTYIDDIEKSSNGYYKITISKEDCKTYNLRNTYVEKTYKNVMKEYNKIKNLDYSDIYKETYANEYKRAYDYYNSDVVCNLISGYFYYIDVSGQIVVLPQPKTEEELDYYKLRILTAETYADTIAKVKAEPYATPAIEKRKEWAATLKSQGIEKPFKEWADSLKIELLADNYHTKFKCYNPYFNMQYDFSYETMGDLLLSSDYEILSKLVKKKKLKGVCCDFAFVQVVICRALNIKCYYVINEKDNHSILLMRGDKGSTGRYNYYEGSNGDAKSVDKYIEKELEGMYCIKAHWQKDIKDSMGKDYPKNGCLSGEYTYYFKNGKLVLDN